MADAGLISLCDSAALQEGGAGVRFEVMHGGEIVAAFAVRHRGRALAYLNRCAHVAMELDWVPGEFFDSDAQFLMCATHGAIYEPGTGACLGGPCSGRGGLIRVPLVEREHQVFWRSDAVLQALPAKQPTRKGED